jgi:uncharacterized damage-inducible protein DinB
MDPLRYPLGKPVFSATLPAGQRATLTDDIAAAPAALRHAVDGLTDAQLDTPYRSGGWTVRQVVHHVPDSHVNAYIRFRLALTEDIPTIKPYAEARWAELPDARTGAIAVSLTLLDATHDRWVRLLRAMTTEQFGRTLNHPENGVMTLDMMLASYAWHGAHHIAHVTGLRQREGW